MSCVGIVLDENRGKITPVLTQCNKTGCLLFYMKYRTQPIDPQAVYEEDQLLRLGDIICFGDLSMKLLSAVTFASLFAFSTLANAGQLDGHTFCRKVQVQNDERTHCVSFNNDVATDNFNTFTGKTIESFKYALDGMQIIYADTGANTAYQIQQRNIVIAETSEVLVRQPVQTGIENPTFRCECTGGQGHYRYYTAPVRGNSYGGPGNYRFETWVCPEDCKQVNF